MKLAVSPTVRKSRGNGGLTKNSIQNYPMMKSKVKYLVLSASVGACVALLPLSLVQAQSPSPTESSSGGSSPAESSAGGTLYQGFVMGSKIAGSPVQDSKGDNLGKISDVVVNPGTGHIRFAVVSTGSHSVAIPWSAFNVQSTTQGSAPKFVANTTKAKLENAPKFDHSKLTQMFDRTMEEPVFTYYDLIWFPDVLTPDEQSSKSKASGSPSPSPTATP